MMAGTGQGRPGRNSGSAYDDSERLCVIPPLTPRSHPGAAPGAEPTGAGRSQWKWRPAVERALKWELHLGTWS